MPLFSSPITAGLETLTSVSDLVRGILERSDRDEPDNLRAARIGAWIEAIEKWPTDNGDAAAAFIVRLLAASNHPPAPERDIQRALKGIIHSCGLSLIDQLHERDLAARAFAKLTAR